MNCPKHAEFYSKNKFDKLVHLVGFIISNTVVQLGANISGRTIKELVTSKQLFILCIFSKFIS